MAQVEPGITYLNIGYTGGASGGQTYGVPTLVRLLRKCGVETSMEAWEWGCIIVLSAGSLQSGDKFRQTERFCFRWWQWRLYSSAVCVWILGTTNVSAVGGNASEGMQAGNGGVGRIMVGHAEDYTGATTPAAYTVLDTNSDNVTMITNQPVSQTNFLAPMCLQCWVYGLPTLMFQWNFNSLPIPGQRTSVVLDQYCAHQHRKLFGDDFKCGNDAGQLQRLP